MIEWKRVKLSELGEIVGGATPSTSHEAYYNGYIPWLTPKDLAGYTSRYIKSGERNITKEGLDSCSAKMMPKNTVLFSSRAPIGYIAIAENDIYLKYDEMSKGKTSLFISHRLASTRFCDRIIFLENGGIREEGTHEQLLQQGGGYAKLFEIQSRYYKEGKEF